MEKSKNTTRQNAAKSTGSSSVKESQISGDGSPDRFKRRELLKVLSAVPAAAFVPLKSSMAASSPAAVKPDSAAQERLTSGKGPYQPKVLNEHEWRTISLLSDLIIPADERSGSATQAGVPAFIDDWLSFKSGDLLAQIRGGLVWLDMECNRGFNRDFVDCTQAEQMQMLDRIAFPKRA